MTTFNITAGPDTDIWRKPPHIDVFTAPTASPPGTSSSSGPLSSFRSAQASFSFAWTEQYDQAGLLLSLQPSHPTTTTTTTVTNDTATDTTTTITNTTSTTNPTSTPTCSPPRWIKTGIEFYNGIPKLSTVSCFKWADWSVSSLSAAVDSPADTWTTIRVERVDGEHGQDKGASLWVYQVLPDGTKNPLREICWVYEDDDPDVWTLEVLAMAARPNKNATSGLKVQFKDVVVEWAS